MVKLHKFLCLLLVLCPGPIKILVYRKILGWKIGSNAKIGFSYIHSNQVEIGDNVRISHFNVFRNLKSLVIASDCYIANFNEFFGTCLYEGEQWKSSLFLEPGTMIMSHHFFDVGGEIHLGAKTVVGGRDSHFWGHTRKYDENHQPILEALNIYIAEDVYIGARATLIGCSIPKGTIIGAGSVITSKEFKLDESIGPSSLLIAGNPASIRKVYHH
jgi:acetyltransferase-like isoleucine patch superfamily enzyme